MHKRFYPQLEGIRGFAVFSVLLSHWIVINYFPQFIFLKLGFLGVNIFFVLSGFLITEILLNEIDDKNKVHSTILTNFYLKRILRIFPIYYWSIIVLAIFKISNSQTILPWTLTYSLNIGQNWFGISNPLFMHIWSLCVEEQFYMIWPLLLIFINKKRHLKLIISIILLSITFKIIINQLFTNHIDINHSNTLASMDALGLGGLIAYIKTNKSVVFKKLQSIPGFFIPILLFLFWILSYTFPEDSLINESFLRFFTSLIGGLLIIKGTMNINNNLIGILLTNRFVRYLGKISYGVYLYHWLISYILRQTFTDLWSSINFGPFQIIKYQHYLGSFLFYFLITLTVASFSYFFIEKPFLNLKKKFS